MTNEEAIWTLENGAWWDSLPDDISDADKNPLISAIELAVDALKGHTGEPPHNRTAAGDGWGASLDF